MKGFPLTPFFRQVTEGNLEMAEDLLAQSELDLRRLLNGDPRTGTFKDDADPVDLVIAHATQVQLCRSILRIDDDANIND